MTSQTLFVEQLRHATTKSFLSSRSNKVTNNSQLISWMTGEKFLEWVIRNYERADPCAYEAPKLAQMVESLCFGRVSEGL